MNEVGTGQCVNNKYWVLKSVLLIRIRFGSGFNGVSVSRSGFEIRIAIQIREGKNYQQKLKIEIFFIDFIFRSAGCSLWGLKASHVAWTSLNEAIFSILVNKTLDPDPIWNVRSEYGYNTINPDPQHCLKSDRLWVYCVCQCVLQQYRKGFSSY
jgi:hypothetical protein